MERLNNIFHHKQNRIFLSYTFKDKDIARKIIEKLQDTSVIDFLSICELNDGDLINREINSVVSSGDFVILLISHNYFLSNWIDDESIKYFLNDLSYRDVTLIPVLLEKISLPAMLKECQPIDISRNPKKGIEKIVSQIHNIPKIDFSIFSPPQFHNLVIDLLKKLKFSKIEKNIRYNHEEFDAKAEFISKDPFGKEIVEKWLIEIKFYSQERANLGYVDKFRTLLRRIEDPHNGLLITNGQLTSIVRNKLEYDKEINRTQFRVIDGIELKRLLLENESLIKKYFDNDEVRY